MAHALVEVVLGFIRRGDLGARMLAHGERGLDHVLLRRAAAGVPVVTGQIDAHGVVRGSELHHVDALDRKNVLDVFDGAVFLDHQRHDGIFKGLHKSLAAAGIFPAIAHVAAGAGPVASAGGGSLGAHRGHAVRSLGR